MQNLFSNYTVMNILNMHKIQTTSFNTMQHHSTFLLVAISRQIHARTALSFVKLCYTYCSYCWQVRQLSIPRARGELAEDKGTSFGLQGEYAINH